MTGFLTLDDLDVAGRVVLVRADLNVPIEDGIVEDDFRIGASIDTIAALRAWGAQVVVCSHLGRPTGPDPRFSMRPVGERLGELGGFEVVVAPAVAGDEAASTVQGAGDAVVLLENTRFEEGETSNDPGLSDRLASLADLFVLDAFGSAHRAHASTVGVAERLRSGAGRLMASEVKAFQRLLSEPDRPYIVVLGGAKVSDKLGVISALLPKVDVMLIGGAMCFTLLVAEGYEVGESRVESEMVEEARRVLDGPHGGRITLPSDFVVGDRFDAGAESAVAPADRIPHGMIGLDIGPETSEQFGAIVAGSDTVFWNGPMGVFEWQPFALGTRAVADAVASNAGYTVVGGGDSVTALRAFGLEGRVSHLSTGGGAGLELLEQGSLPGLDALKRWADDT